ncbi:MAG: VanW family protein [Christensenellaceae bacterium]|nr:VanW family protein [Christensenellaceae bacterium]
MRKITNYFEEETKAPERKEKTPRNKKNADKKPGNKKVIVIIIAVIAALLVAAGIYFALDAAGITPASKRRAYMEAINTSDTFLKGVEVDGVDISGLTVEEAAARIEQAHAEDPFEEVRFVLSLPENAKAIKDAADIAREEAAKELEETLKETEEANEGNPIVEEGEIVEEEPAPEAEPVDPYADIELEKDTEDNYIITKKDVTMTFNTMEVLEEALNLAKNIEKYDDMVAEVENIAATGRKFETEYTVDTAAAERMIEAIAADCKTEPIDASFKFNIEAFTVEDDKKDENAPEPEKIIYIDELRGMEIDVDMLKMLVADKASVYDFSGIEMPFKEIQADVTIEEIKGQVSLRGTATTEFKKSSSNRIHNVTKAANLVNGIVVQPGETFSTNDALGVRLEKNGWKMAGALQGGQVDVQQAGGGVCQLATTMYNAVVKGDLEIVYRQEHSEKSNYVDGGLDATINSVGNIIDFKWKNNTDSPIIIVAYTTPSKQLTVDIYGAPFSGEYDEIRLSSKLLETIVPTTDIVYQEDPTLAPGQTKEKVKRRNGSKWVSYKHYYKDGVEIKDPEILDYSSYRTYAGVTLVGPGTPGVVIAPAAPAA